MGCVGFIMVFIVVFSVCCLFLVACIAFVNCFYSFEIVFYSCF